MAVFRHSAQRKALLNYLQSVKTHPTAAALFERLRREFPNLSLGTIYRNLDILQRQGLVRQLIGEGRETRFDSALMPHGHFFCRICGQVEDFAWTGDGARRTAARLKGRRVEEVKLEARGLCAKCVVIRKTKGGRS